MKMIIETAIKIPREVKNELIKSFVKKCKEKHALAFLQWRLLYSNSKTSSNDLLKSITDRQWHMNMSFKRRKNFEINPTA